MSSVVLHLPDGTSLRSELRVMRVDKQVDESIHLGVRFESLTAHAERKLANYVIRALQEREAELGRLLTGPTALRSTEQRFIGLLLQRHAATRRGVFIFEGERRLPFAFRINSVDQARTPCRLSLQAQRGPQTPPLTSLVRAGGRLAFVLEGPVSVTLFFSRVERIDESHLDVAMPAEILQTGFRQSPRVRPRPEDRGQVALTHERRPESRIEGPITTVAGGGLSVRVDTTGQPVVPGDRLSRLLVSLPTGKIEATGIVRGTSGDPTTGELICGIELLDFSGSTASRRWHEYVFRSAFPRLVDDQESGPERSWELLETSKYLDMWTDEDVRSELRSRFLRTWSSPAPEASQRLVLRSGNVDRAGLMATLVYPRTWMFHQMGVAEGERKRGDRVWFSYVTELFGGLSYSLKHLHGLEYLVIYFDAGKSWNDLVYGEFARRYTVPARLGYDELSVFRATARCSKSGSEVNCRRTNIAVFDAATEPSLWSLLQAFATAHISPLERAAFALDDASLSATDTVDDRARLGPTGRTRSFFVASGSSGPLGGILAEVGDDGASVFGLMNTARILPLAGAWPDPEIVGVLLARVQEHYRLSGKLQHLLFAPPRLPDAQRRTLENAGYSFVSEGLRWLAHRTVLPLWTAYLDELLASLALEKAHLDDSTPDSATASPG